MTNLVAGTKDLHLFHEGTLYQGYQFFGAHLVDGPEAGVQFTVWAPNAQSVEIVGDFNEWNGENHSMDLLGDSGVWQLHIPGLDAGTIYKYSIVTPEGNAVLKADPYAFYSQVRPDTASVVANLDSFEWNDSEWRENKKDEYIYHAPVNIYEVHLGSWKRDENGEFLTYRELADELIDYVLELGYTHIEPLPLTEHPFDGSWGYQVTGYYSITSRYGAPEDFMYFVDRCHQRGIGVILDWVPGHFVKDEHGLAMFDGTPCYEYADPRKADRSNWGTYVFDYAKPEVLSFLIGSAVFWMDKYHVDGLRIDAVTSMLFLNFEKDESLWVKNELGGEENLEAIEFMKKLNSVVFGYFPKAIMAAEDCSEWTNVTTPVCDGGLGFNFKWNMSWMGQVLNYMRMNAIERKDRLELVTSPFFQAFTENYIMAFSHDEVSHGYSLLATMSGDDWQKRANLRLLYGYTMGHPGKKLFFMGCEFGQKQDWDVDSSLHWDLLDVEEHSRLHKYMRDLNHLYRSEKALWQMDTDPAGLFWIHSEDDHDGVVIFKRQASDPSNTIIVVCNFSSDVYDDYKVGVPDPGYYSEIFNSDAEVYGGTGRVQGNEIATEEYGCHNQPYCIQIQIPPLAAMMFKLQRERKDWKIHETKRLRRYAVSRRRRSQIESADRKNGQARRILRRPI